MTVSIEVRIAERARALSVPSRTLVQREDRTFVRILRPDTTVEERTVRTGLPASDGFVEILEGLSEGEKIVTFLPK
jgi:multidrug efflux pump subunit AcrA (membrane-fusion protein)